MIRKIINSFGFDFCRIGKKRLGRNFDADLQAITLPDGDIFDVGANTGRAARHLAGLFPQSRIWSFEPCKESFDVLCASQDLTSIRKFHCAVGASDKKAVLNKFAGSELNSLLARTTQADQFIDPSSISEAGNEEITVNRLDTITAENRISRISLLKVDTQGYELEVLKGSSGLLAAGNIDVIQLEVNFSPLYQHQPSFSDILDHLSPLNYGLVGLYDVSRNDNGCMKWCDALFKRDLK